MPIIRSQHLNDRETHVPRDDWPEDCVVQWGGGGIVLGASPYRTAFFEAFPKAGGFIRGEGPTVTEAEDAAMAKYLRHEACTHLWSRKFPNGLGHCRRCGATRSGMFPAIVGRGAWRAPLSGHEVTAVLDGHIEPIIESRHNDPAYSRRIWLRCKMHGLHLPPIPTEGRGILEDSDYMRACDDIVCAWIEEKGFLDQGPDPDITTMKGLFGIIQASQIKRHVERWRKRQAEGEAVPDSMDLG